MKRMSVGLLLSLLFCIILVVVIVQGAYSIISLQSIEQSSTQIVQKRVPSFIALGQLNADIGDVRIAQSALLISGKDEFDGRRVALGKAEQDVASDRAIYEPLMVDEGDRELYGKFAAAWTSTQELWDKVVATKQADQVSASALFYGDSFKAYTTASDDIQAAVNDLAQNAKDEGAASQEAISWTKSATYIGLSIAVVLGISAMVMSYIRIVRPVISMTSFMTQLANGDTTTGVPSLGRGDEIGAMAAAVQHFKDGMLRNSALELEAEASRRQAEFDRARLIEEAETAARKHMQEATAGLASGLKRLAAGDLSFELTETFSPDFEALRHDLNGAVSQLANTLRSVAQSTSSIDGGAREISRSADDLSRRTEQQAASLEETAAALDQITVNVSNSSERADEARAVAIQANASAAQSGTVVANAVNAMQRIEASSTQISNIIGVIDEIAFQTNLLALNAGVEAARAGEAGRGFAVVAQEVRELAQRSAKAAKEIKGLISTSTAEVESGVKLVRATGDALKTIETYIVTINQHMDSIATSAREQSTGLGEVNTAVNQMDQVTQQNAAMVEETNAASATLAADAVNLRDVISQFNLGGNAVRASNVSALRETASAMAKPSHVPQRQVPVPARKMVANTGRAAESWEEF
ncbi:methyl-accepting chemotaxis protein [Rhizobium sp. VS19-DR104.2]|uniref:methyl-accepting chemotaxis protein n=1 Tax=unclassified Rhizobium TaxID=2613769 RepID=UPI001C5B13DE|nr:MULTISPECIES: methyl-accepting chemotaxis protein [unclassified Rhizobium]MBZ5763791.1 methyl-accepting chemotaxis protein [Rhizobium sp. VS19-DR96]MBZ5769727.1 methyl-accepting chemotaxis protein [Rhizobium sp. VS19-DR129.2]MBZ5777272.1 methyl-accepting chemotaxis protein [Rhizobium sp. VS19-DRK62.2]MBZ5788397.1 methyl-accepting chemotaxis protein [Rhizobium sp. VS19-DR121]MBZ5805845.1 methyl-accepting chemotaxis protein [Rhizobium sp. VS19-DR181]